MAVINESGNRIRNGNGNTRCGEEIPPIRRQFSARFHKHKKPISITFSIRGGFFGLSMQHETAAAGNICCCCCSSNSCCCYKFVAARISFIETLIAHVKITARCHLAQFGGRPPKWICVFCCSSVFSSFQTLVQVAFAFPLFFLWGRRVLPSVSFLLPMR